MRKPFGLNSLLCMWNLINLHNYRVFAFTFRQLTEHSMEFIEPRERGKYYKKKHTKNKNQTKMKTTQQHSFISIHVKSDWSYVFWWSPFWCILWRRIFTYMHQQNANSTKTKTTIKSSLIDNEQLEKNIRYFFNNDMRKMTWWSTTQIHTQMYRRTMQNKELNMFFIFFLFFASGSFNIFFSVVRYQITSKLVNVRSFILNGEW